jgi:AraC family transcriptional regulator
MSDRLPSLPAELPQRRPISNGRDWRLAEYVCDAGPDDRPVEERHDGVLVAAVVAGTFSYHGDTGRGVLVPGSLMLGNHGTCYACGHEHSRGDRCIALHIAPDFFEEVTASIAGSSRYRFAMTHLPPNRGILAQTVRLEALAREDRLASEQAVPLLIESLLRLVCATPVRAQRVSPADHRRVARAIALLEDNYAAEVDLESLAGEAATSKYHFLRVFRRVAGMTPYQYLLQVRLRRVAAALATRPGRIVDLALESGFRDLSGFNHRFRSGFGVTPRVWRSRHSRLKGASR